MERHSPALIVCKEEDAVSHGHVLYGLVKPGKGDKGVESAAAMVNVIPRKRIYRMETIQELDTFQSELLKRPLVLQPVMQVGSGIQSLNCFFCVQKENWVVMLNQNHPKIMGRIMMGIDTAKSLMKRGQPFILEFLFSDVIERLYFSSMAHTSPRKYQYLDCHHGDLIIRGGREYLRPGVASQVKAQYIKFEFEDLINSDIKVRTLKDAAYECQSPIIKVIPDRTLREILPGWSFEQVMEEEDEEEEEEEQEVEGAVGYQQPIVQTGRIRGRANRGAAASSSSVEVSVELHVPNNEEKQDSDWYSEHRHAYQSDSRHYTALNSARSPEHIYNDIRAPARGPNHYHQGSGRSGSSATDSGYEGENDMGGFEDRKRGHLKQGNGYSDNMQGKAGYPYNRLDNGYSNNRQDKSYCDNVSPGDRYNYDNPAFTPNDNYNMLEESVERHKAMAARLLQNKGGSMWGGADHRYREMNRYNPPTHMPTISQSIDSHTGESAI